MAAVADAMTTKRDPYNDAFYENTASDTLSSARVYLAHVWTMFQPVSVLDAGCGRGFWLKACRELGAKELFGVDGAWNDQSKMIDDGIVFTAVDLNRALSWPRRVDLVMSLEVAEHLEPSSSDQFVASLTEAADVVLFSAAFPRQGGTNHINERPHSGWARMFQRQGYVPFDLFRPAFWADERVAFWYRQNAFLYVRKHTDAHRRMRAQGCHELTEFQFMDCIHPRLYELRCGVGVGFRTHAMGLMPSFLRALRRRVPALDRWA